MEGVRVSMDCLLPGYSNDRAFVRMELHQPVSVPSLQSLTVFLEFLQSCSVVRVRYMMMLSGNSLTEECLVYSIMPFN